MMRDEERDALLLSLASLPSTEPGEQRDARTRRRCHAVLARRTVAEARARRARRVMAKAADVALTAVLCGYAAVALFEAFRLTLAL